jgi:hypothetical protein
LMTEAFNIGVVGCRYVGLVTGACLSHLGHRAVCVDKDEERIRALESGRLPFYELGLEQFTKKEESPVGPSASRPSLRRRCRGPTWSLFAWTPHKAQMALQTSQASRRSPGT